MKSATLLETWKTLLTVLLEHDNFREEHFQQCLVFFGDSFLTMKREKTFVVVVVVKSCYCDFRHQNPQNCAQKAGHFFFQF